MVAERQKTESQFVSRHDFSPILRAVCHATSATVAALARVEEADIGLVAARGLCEGEEISLRALIADWQRGADAGSSASHGFVLFGTAIIPTAAATGSFVLVACGRIAEDMPREGSIAALADLAKWAQLQLDPCSAQSPQPDQQSGWTSQTPLADAIDAFPDAIAVFDAHDRFQYWNHAFQELYESEGAPLRVGVTFEEHVRLCVAEGKVPAAKGREEEWIRDRLARFRAGDATHEHQLRNHRWIRVQERPLRGGGRIGIRTDITELVERERSFRLLFDANPAPMLVIDQESLRILAANDAALDFYGYDREAFLELSLPDIRPPDRNEDPRVMMRTADQSAWAETLRVNRTASGEERIVKVQASLFSYQGRAAIFGAVTDMTSQQAVQRKLDEARAFLSQIVDEVPSILFVKDGWDNGNYLLMNKAGALVTGRSEKNILGHNDGELFGPEFSTEILEEDRLLLAGSTVRRKRDKKIPRADGAIRWVRTRKVVLPDVSSGAPRYVLGIGDDVTDIKAAEERIAHHAYHDALTDLPNRLMFRERLDRELVRLETSRSELAVMLLDLDGFKPVNDSWGHDVGDELLKQVANRMQALVRPNNIAARLGGDEFAILLSRIENASEAEWIAGQLLARLAQPYEINGNAIHISASIGIAMMPPKIIDASTLMRQADEALYVAKREGRNQFRVASDGDEPERDVDDDSPGTFVRRTAMS